MLIMEHFPLTRHGAGLSSLVPVALRPKGRSPGRRSQPRGCLSLQPGAAPFPSLDLSPFIRCDPASSDTGSLGFSALMAKANQEVNKLGSGSWGSTDRFGVTLGGQYPPNSPRCVPTLGQDGVYTIWRPS